MHEMPEGSGPDSRANAADVRVPAPSGFNAAQQSAWSALASFRPGTESDREALAQFRVLVQEHANCTERSLLHGHLTASAWLVSVDGKRLLMTHHRKLDRWLQLGGHADGDGNLAQVALREAMEESGLPKLRVEPHVFDLDRHWIPERGDVPGHWHYDVRYVVRCEGAEAFAVSDESHALAWREIAALVEEPGIDASIVRMAKRWLERSATL